MLFSSIFLSRFIACFLDLCFQCGGVLLRPAATNPSVPRLAGPRVAGPARCIPPIFFLLRKAAVGKGTDRASELAWPSPLQRGARSFADAAAAWKEPSLRDLRSVSQGCKEPATMRAPVARYAA